MVQLFGFKFGETKKQEKADPNIKSFAPPPNEDGAIEVAPGGAYGTFVDLEGTAKNEAELVTRYRGMSLQAECDKAIEDIIDEAIITENPDKLAVEINLENTKLSDGIKKKILVEYEEMVKLLKFDHKAHDLFRRWYVDGRMYYHMMIDIENPKKGIVELRYVDPRKIRKIREPINEKDPASGQMVNKGFREYYIYSPRGLSATAQGIRISPDAVCYVTSGVMDQKNTMVLGHLHKAIKPLNQLRMLEDATVIYRLSRAPERRIFYIDVGNLPKAKAEQYLRDMMVKHKNRLVYDASTGAVRDDRKFMTMLEDFWLPRREGGKGTEITTLPGGQNLGEMDDVEYFKKGLYKSLNVPLSRMESETQFNLGRSTEISRDEVMFNKFVQRLRARFTMLFLQLLKTQLMLKGVMTSEEWKEVKHKIKFDFQQDNYFTELKEGEMMKERLAILQEADQFEGRYVSQGEIWREILRYDEEKIQQIKDEIAAEDPMSVPPDKMQDGAMPEDTPVPDIPEPDAEKPKKEHMYVKNADMLNETFEQTFGGSDKLAGLFEELDKGVNKPSSKALDKLFNALGK